MTFTPHEAAGHSRLLDPPDDYTGPVECRCGWKYDTATCNECPQCQSESVAASLVDEVERFDLGTSDDRKAFHDEIHDHLLKHHEHRETLASAYGTEQYDVIAVWLFLHLMDRVTR